MDTLTRRDHLAWAYRDAVMLDQAIRIFEQTLETARGSLGPPHPQTLSTMNGLANAYVTLGQVDRGIGICEDILEQSKTVYGPSHPTTINVIANLGSAYRSAGKYDRAISLLTQTEELCKSRFGPDHPDTLAAYHNLALAYMESGQTFKHPFAGRIIGQLANCYENLDHPGDAEPWLRKLLASVKEQQGSQTMAYANVLLTMGWNLLQQERWTEAESTLRECLAIHQVHEPDLYSIFMTQSLLGEALLAQGKYAEAEPLLLQGYEGLMQREAKIPKLVIHAGRLMQSLERLPRLYNAWGKPEKPVRGKKTRRPRGYRGPSLAGP